MDRLLLELLTDLEAIGERNGFLFDTEVRERLGDPIFFGFIKAEPGYVPPDDYGMPDEENRLIRAALLAYVEQANRLAPALGLQTFHQRLAAFQDDAVRTDQGSDYHDIFGGLEPDAFDEAGNVKSVL